MNELYTYVYTKAIKKYAFHDFPEIRLAPLDSEAATAMFKRFGFIVLTSAPAK